MWNWFYDAQLKPVFSTWVANRQESRNQLLHYTMFEVMKRAIRWISHLKIDQWPNNVTTLRTLSGFRFIVVMLYTENKQ